MLLHPPTGRSEIPAAALAEVTALYLDARYLQAYRRAEQIAPLRQWLGAEAQVMAGRILGNLMGQRESRFFHLRAWREHRTDPMAAYYRALDLLQRRGPLAAWKFLGRLPDFADANPERRADLLTARADVLTQFRDFEGAEAALAEAEALEGSERPWLWTQRASLLKARDRYDEAVAAVDRALELQPWYRPAVQHRAELLQLVGRDEEAAAFLAEAMGQMESVGVAAQLHLLQTELERHEESRETLHRLRELIPAMEPEAEKWWHARMSDVCYALGDVPGAAEHAARAHTPFFERLAGRLAAPGAEARPVRWRVPFVRQHHVTCAPATISALSRFFGSPIDHLELARVICYDGTPPHVERHWLEEHGWVVREFRVTWEILRALLDRGLPFTLATVETQSAHLQAVVGYDALRGTLYIRDPYERTHSEALGEEFLARYAASGPRGSIFLRPEQVHRLEGLELPEAELYDRCYAVARALHTYDRDAADRQLEALAGLAPDGRLTWEARRLVANYDSHRGRQLEAVEALLALHPDEGNLLLTRVALLRETADREVSRAAVRELAGRPAAQPIFWREWAEELMRDARRHGEAERQLLRALRFQPGNTEILRSLAQLYWGRQQFARGAELYRFCACLGDKRDDYAHTYLLAARHLRAAEAPLTLFRQRFAAFGARSAQPLRVLFGALTTLDRPPEAFAALEEALRLRPDDGELLLFAADACARYGEPERAATLLAAADSRSPRAQWLRTAAALADYRCALAEALALWRQILPEEPLAMDAQQTVTRLLAEVEGRAAARAHLQAACARFPHYVPLWTLAVEWARHDGHGATETLIRDLLVADPQNAWAHRELAISLAGQRRFEEADRQLALARELEADAVSNFTVQAHVDRAAHRLPEAREAARAALRISVDHPGALQQLVEASETFAEKREAIGFIRGELVRQVVLGDGLLTYRELAFPILEPEELLAGLREAHAARPDLWHAWVALTLQLNALRLLDEALTMAVRATELFPLHAQPWLQLALVHGARGEGAEEIRPLGRALILQPAWGRASRVLAQVHEHLGDFAEAERVLERAIAAAPLDPVNHYALAELRGKRGRRPEAFANLEHALKLEPGLEAAWSLLREWGAAAGETDRAARLARALAEVRPGEPRSWYIVAQALPSELLEERLAAVDRAVALSPHYVDAYEAKAFLLAGAGRFDEAAAACAPPAWSPENLPYALAGRAAWIEARRGNLQTAIARMREIVASTPDYYWGWNQLVEWHANSGQLKEAREATQQMARLVPHSAIPLGYIADLQERLGDKAEALVTLRRALKVDPAYAFAAQAIFRLHLENQDWAAAERAIVHLRLHLPGAETEASAIRLETRRSRTTETLERFRQLCTLPESETHALETAARALVDAGRGSSVEAICREHLFVAGANPAVGYWWAERVAHHQMWGERKHLYLLDPASPIGRRAYYAFIEGLALKNQRRLLRELLRRRGPALRQIPHLWAIVGYAFVQLGRFDDAVKWLHDWRRRERLEPWMLLNLACALRRVSRKEALEEAVEVNRHALTLPADHSTAQHQTWVALEEALLGHQEAAARLMAETASATVPDSCAALRRLIDALLHVQAAPMGDRRSVFAGERKRLKGSRYRAFLFAEHFRPVLRRAFAAMANMAGVFNNPAWQWTFVRSARPAQPSTAGTGANVLRYWWILAILGANFFRLCSPDRPLPSANYTVPDPPRVPPSLVWPTPQPPFPERVRKSETGPVIQFTNPRTHQKYLLRPGQEVPKELTPDPAR